MNNDKPLLAAIIGALSTLLAEIVSRIMLYWGVGRYSIYQLDSMILTMNRPNFLLGLYVNFVIGGLIGILFYYTIKAIGQTNLIVKGIFLGLLASALAEMLFSAVIEGKFIELRPLGDYYLHVAGSAFFGLGLGFFFQRYLFNSSTAANS